MRTPETRQWFQLPNWDTHFQEFEIKDAKSNLKNKYMHIRQKIIIILSNFTLHTIFPHIITV